MDAPVRPSWPRRTGRTGASILRGSDFLPIALSACHCADDEERLNARCDSGWQECVWGRVREVLFTGEESQQRTTLVSDVISNCAAENRVAGLQSVED